MACRLCTGMKGLLNVKVVMKALTYVEEGRCMRRSWVLEGKTPQAAWRETNHTIGRGSKLV